MYQIQWEFNPKRPHYWTGFGAGYSTSKKAVKLFGNQKQAEVESDKILRSRKIGASPRWTE